MGVRRESYGGPITPLGGGGPVSGSGAASVVWRPSGPNGGNVYATWAQIVAVVASLNGEVTIGIDTDFGAANIPPGNYDLRPAGVSGPVFIVNASKIPGFTAPFVTIVAGATTIHGLSGIDDVSVVNNSTVAVIVLTGNSGTFEMWGRAGIFQASTGPFISVTGGRILLALNDLSNITAFGGTGAISVTGPGVIDLVLGNDSFLGVNELTAAAAAQVSAAIDMNAVYSSQAITAPLVVPGKSMQRGSAVIDGVTGKSANIVAILSATTQIQCTQKIPVGDGGAGPTVRYAALNADRVLGALGMFKISALTAVGGGAVNAGDGSTVDWVVIN